ncbi:MAG: hypothetical protein QY326_09405 [Bdellovibrionota bacterium]|nr:MAG: hypothetical protein QY326_09405 [Bdellovibrionota bacterium]
MRNSKKKLHPKQLQSQIESETTPAQKLPEFDASDSDPLSYVEQFLRHDLDIGPLEKVDLMTPESARQALTLIGQQYRLVQERLKTSNALKKMLQSYQPPPIDSEQH